ncbi:unnamed protein product, partial [Musa acuminata subsp. burmannicoides]
LSFSATVSQELVHFPNLSIWRSTTCPTGKNGHYAGWRKFLGHSFPGTCAFPKLEYLEINDVPNWEEWSLCGVE